MTMMLPEIICINSERLRLDGRLRWLLTKPGQVARVIANAHSIASRGVQCRTMGSCEPRGKFSFDHFGHGVIRLYVSMSVGH